MHATVSLLVTEGPLEGEEIVFSERGEYVLGRGAGCYPQLPNDRDHLTISRHHCLLDVRPPNIWVRDLGSRNGTYLNGHRIGGPDHVPTPEEQECPALAEQRAREGDEIRVGNTVFRVQVAAVEDRLEPQVGVPRELQLVGA